MADESVKRHIRRARELNGNRSTWHDHWEDCARIFLPRRTGFTTTNVEGDRRTENLFDGSPMRAARGLANALGGIIRPDGQKWFHMKAVEDREDENDQNKDWMEAVEDRMREKLEDPKSRFRQATGETDLDLVVFGTGVMYEGEASDLQSLIFQSVHLKDAMILFSDEGNAAGLYRFRKMTIRQAVERWGEERLSEKIKEKISNNKVDERIEFLQIVVKREEGRADAMMATNMPYSNMWVETDAEHIIVNGGHMEFPFVVPRWDTSSGEQYGRSPAMIGLPDGLTLQAMGETILVAGQRRADPPLAAPADSAFNEVNTYPGGLSYYDPATAQGRNPFFEIGNGGDIGLTREMQQDYREQVFSAFFRNVLNLPVEGPQMTATEVIQRKEEFIREIGPVFGRLETEYTAPMIEREFMIMLRAGEFPDPPEDLRSIRFEYQSPVKQVRQQIEASAARMWVQELVEYSGATGDMSALDIINVDEYGRHSATAQGIPEKLVASRDEVDEKREARQQAQQEAQAAEQAAQTAQTAKTGAEAAKAAGVDIGALAGAEGA